MAKENANALVYDSKDIQDQLKIGRTTAYDFIRKVYQAKAPFPVLKVGSQYRIPKEPFDLWIAGKSCAKL